MPGSRDSQSSTRPKPMSALPPMPTMWLKPTPFGSAQSITARHSDADCETSPIRPAGGDQMRARGIQPDGGHGDAERARPQHTNSAAETRGQSGRRRRRRPRPRSVPLAASARRIWGDGGVAMTARSAADREHLDALCGVSVQHPALEAPGPKVCRHLRANLRPPADRQRSESGRNRQTGLKRPAGLLRSRCMVPAG